MSDAKREFEAEQAEARAREAEGIFDHERVADLFRSGELTYEELLEMARQGRIRVVYARSHTERGWEEIAAEPRANAIYGLRLGGHITVEQQKEVEGAMYAAVGFRPDGRAPAAPVRAPGPQHYTLTFDNGPKPYALVRAERGIVWLYTGGLRGKWVDAPHYVDVVYGPEKHEATEIKPEAAEAMIAAGEAPVWTDEVLAGIDRRHAEYMGGDQPPAEPTGPSILRTVLRRFGHKG